MRLVELVGTLSLAADTGTGMPDETGLRVAAAAAKIGQCLEANAADRASAFYLALLRFIGCTGDSTRASEAFGDEVEFGRQTQGLDYGNPREMFPAVLRLARKGKGPIDGTVAMVRTVARLMAMMKTHHREHCEVADLLAARLGFEESVRAALVQNNERWDGSGSGKVRGEAIALPMRIAHVAYDFEIGHRFGGAAGARERLVRLRGTSLDPTLVDRVLGVLDDVVAVLEVPSAWAALLEAEPTPHREVTNAAFDEAIATMAAFADLRSKYTRNHSTGVAELAAAAAASIGLPADMVDDVRRAGLLHDLGRVSITASIWDKTTPLTDLEREKIRLHTYVGERVLSRASSLQRIAEIACLAHERLDGSGYHRRLSAANCTSPARILAAADVYQALVEERPHRPAFTPDAAAAELTKMAETGALCPDAARAVLAVAGHAPKKKVERIAGLTDRELEVLRLLGRGLTNKEIATSLDISTKTAGHHVQHIFEKLGVTTRSAAAICAMQHGIMA